MKVKVPTLLLDEKKCRASIRRMAEKAKNNGVEFQPHFKTHQSISVGEWYKEEGVTSITVSSLGMAGYFANAGWQKINVAFPVNVNQIDQINELAAKVQLTVLLDSIETVRIIDGQLTSTIQVYIEIDSGDGRSGVGFNEADKVFELLTAIERSSYLTTRGFYTHAGHTYRAASKQGILEVATPALENFKSLKRLDNGMADLEFCWGDTPSCSVFNDFEGLDTIGPGNFVFYDLMQCNIGSCTSGQVAVMMAVPVVAKYPERNEIIVYAGAVHLSKDNITLDGKTIYGRVYNLIDNAWEEYRSPAYVKKLSQEHGVVVMNEKEADNLNIGDVIGIMPVHSCLAAQCVGAYRTLEGKLLDHYAQKKHD